MIRSAIDNHKAPTPAVLEIPSKDHPYDPSKDSILARARGMFSTDDFKEVNRGWKHINLSSFVYNKNVFEFI